jgi:hypothetical protein
MSVLEKLASSLGRRDKEPNKDLAKEIADREDHEAIEELVEHLEDADRNLQSDCIEALYETGYINANLIAPHTRAFGNLLQNKNNRLVWGAMIALDSIARVAPMRVFDLFPEIVEALDKGSVITKDCGVGILSSLSAIPECRAKIFPLLMNELRRCPPKQLPTYAGKALVAINETNRKEFIELIHGRIPDLEKESQRKKIKKILRDLDAA